MFKNANKINKMGTKIGNLASAQYKLIEEDLKAFLASLADDGSAAPSDGSRPIGAVDFSRLLIENDDLAERYTVKDIVWNDDGDMATEAAVTGVSLSASGMVWVTLGPDSGSPDEKRHLTQFSRPQIQTIYETLLQMTAEIDAGELDFEKDGGRLIIKPKDHDA